MVKNKKKPTLRVRYSKKQKDILFYCPLGISTKCDGGYLYGLFNDNFIKEMESRGYDITTLKFSITAKDGETRFNWDNVL